MAHPVGMSRNDASLASTECTPRGSAGAVLLVDLTAYRDNRAIGDDVVIGSAYADAFVCDANISQLLGSSSNDILRAGADADDLIAEVAFDHADLRATSAGMHGGLANNARHTGATDGGGLISITTIRADDLGGMLIPGGAM